MLKISKHKIAVLLAYSLVNVVLSLGIVYIINLVISGSQRYPRGYLGLVFFGFTIGSYLLNIFFQKKIIRVTYNMVYDNEFAIIKKITETSMTRLEAIGTERVYGIVEDLRVFVFFPGLLTNAINCVLMIVLCISYLFTISVKGSGIVVFLIAAISFVYFFRTSKLGKKVNTLRNNNDVFNRYVKDVLQGFKELKISLTRRHNLLNRFLGPNRSSSKALDIHLANNFTVLNFLSQYGFYFIIGVILFPLPLLGYISAREVASFVIILLFLSGPITRLISLQNLFTRTMVSSKRIKAFFRDIESGSHSGEEKNSVPQPFHSLALDACRYHYPNGQFSIGPIDFCIGRGEVVFVIGGNGSGKSTFINLLAGLYQPAAGAILLNGKEARTDTPAYQDLLSAVFTDNYLFCENYDDYQLGGNPAFKELLTTMKLDKVISGDEDSAVRRTFSKGQSKRISMIYALLEDHPLLILDEWAADQDPYFRKYFYERLLPKLKAQGKTIIAVTHDDAYFSQADRVIKFDYGKIVTDIQMSEQVFDKEILWNNH